MISCYMTTKAQVVKKLSTAGEPNLNPRNPTRYLTDDVTYFIIMN